MIVEDLLKEIIDPETNYSIFELGFLKKVEVKDEEATVVLSPPTFWCPPAILYIILEELRQKLLTNGYRPKIVLEGHHDADRITRCINDKISFQECYSSESLGTYYEELKRRLFEKQEKKLKDSREARMVNLSLNVNGELCKLLGEVRQFREGLKNS